MEQPPAERGGPARILGSLTEASKLAGGDVLVAHMTAPDWVPEMRRASAIITDSGGMTCHAAIVSRELGIPCVVGTAQANRRLHDGELITVDAGRGLVLEGLMGHPNEPASARPTQVGTIAPVTATRLLVNLSEPSAGVAGLGAPRRRRRSSAGGVDGPEALDGKRPRLLLEEGRGDEFVGQMAQALTVFATGFSPWPITYRTIDFRTNEFAGFRAASGTSQTSRIR